jgi:uncharacterized protein YndB with AHSA1/START domain
MYDIRHRIGINAPIERVHHDLTTIDGLASWWTTDTQGDAAERGKVDFTFGSRGQVTVDVETVTPDRVAWRIVHGPDEWIDTTVEFDLAQEGDETVIQFAHAGWREVVPFTGHCTTKWGSFLLSLKSTIETGSGQPFPHDVHISSWD